MVGYFTRRLGVRVAITVAIACGFGVPTAAASNLIDRNATNVKLQVNSSGMALLTYKAGGKAKHVLAWGAVDAHAPSEAGPQAKFQLDYSGGWSLSHKLPLLWERFKNTCGPYTGPTLQWFVTGCTAKDGTNWVVQSWQRMLPNYGVAATSPMQTVWELRLSHWGGDLPVFTVKQDWAYRRWEDLYGSYMYKGQPMYGFHTTSQGAPLDNYGVLVYLDTYNSAYGPGWMRENSFVTHNPTGVFCYGFFPHAAHPAGNGEQYRATVVGAGVLPDQFWQGASLGAYDKDRDAQANAERKTAFADKLCSYN
jgi:hypothetical protein